VTPCPKPLPREPKPRKGLRREPLCHCGHSREIHDCTKRGLCAHCIWPSCPKFRPKYPRKRKPRRLSRLKARGNTSHARRPRDFDYMGEVAKLPCVVREMAPYDAPACGGRIEVNHVGGRYGKNTDRNTIPMCHEHHKDWTGRIGGGGFFSGWSPGRRRGWGAIAIAVTQQAIADTQGRYSERSDEG
jgi:hypothetical protein